MTYFLRCGQTAPGTLLFGFILALATVSCQPLRWAEPAGAMAGVTYLNHHIKRVPWSVHIVRVDRTQPGLQLASLHAQSAALGLATLSEHVQDLPSHRGLPLAAVNGDFFITNGAYAGDPRGLQIVEGELISAPSEGASFWLDAQNQPQVGRVTSQLRLIWPGGQSLPLGLNEPRTTNAVLYTSSAGRTTGTGWGCELILESTGEGPWLPLRVGQTYSTRVREVRHGGDAPIAPGTLVIALDPWSDKPVPPVQTGMVLRVSTDTLPDLRGATTAISGGPIVLHAGRVQQPVLPTGPNGRLFRYRHMWQRHPRTALGWNDRYFYLVVVDGRQPALSVGMTMSELGQYLWELGCQEAVNLDGGGSATLWYDGAVKNRPSDRGAPSLAPDDFTDLPALMHRLRQPADNLSRLLAGELSDSTRQMLTEPRSPHQERLREELAWDLNRVIWGPKLYRKDLFSGIKLSLETHRLLRLKPKGSTLEQLNRLLLEDALPREIARSQIPRERRIANALAVVRQSPNPAPLTRSRNP
jgi:hypothetical protein